MDEDLQRLIGWFLWYLDCSNEELAARAGVSESSVRQWRKGKTAPRRANIEKLAQAANLSMAFIDSVVLPGIAAVHLGRAGEEEVFRDLTGATRAVEASLGGVVHAAVADLIAFLEEEPVSEREEAWRQSDRLKSLAAEDLWYLIEARPEFQSPELALLLALESAEAASDDAGRALLLARVAHRVAELVPSTALEGLTLALVANARRVANELEEADEEMARARERWQAAGEAERALLPGWRLLDLEASLCRDRRRLPQALKLLEQAQEAAPPEATARILVNKAVTLEHMGDAEGAIEVLREAAHRADGQREPRLPLKIHFNLSANLCHLSRFQEAEALFPTIRDLSDSRKELDEIRMVWLRARIDAGLGRAEQARAGFEQVRGELDRRNMAADYALASLERAVLDLREGRNAEARALADEITLIFNSKGIQPEARAALALFCQAASREQATAELAERMVRYLYRAQYEPGLRFEP